MTPFGRSRAADEIRRELAALNNELEPEWGARLAIRTGVNTGEVVTGDVATRQTFATGDAVNTAARLEQAAGPGEILLSESTRWLVQDAVQVEPVEPLHLKGKASQCRPSVCCQSTRRRPAADDPP